MFCFLVVLIWRYRHETKIKMLVLIQTCVGMLDAVKNNRGKNLLVLVLILWQKEMNVWRILRGDNELSLKGVCACLVKSLIGSMRIEL